MRMRYLPDYSDGYNLAALQSSCALLRNKSKWAAILHELTQTQAYLDNMRMHCNAVLCTIVLYLNLYALQSKARQVLKNEYFIMQHDRVLSRLYNPLNPGTIKLLQLTMIIIIIISMIGFYIICN